MLSLRTDFPRFKRKNIRDSFRFPQGIKLEEANNRIYLPKIGWVKYRNSRKVIGDIGTITISRHCNKWFVSIQTECDIPIPIHSSTTAVGVDLGVARLATLSNEAVYEALDSFRTNERRLAILQRRVSKKKKRSQNWKKAIAKVSLLHRKISRVRLDYLHKMTTAISKNHAMVCIEDLQIKNMSKSASKSKSAPGRNVKAKSGLNKAILDQGWGEFRRQLEYTQEWLGGCVISVSPQYTSMECPACYFISTANRKTQEHFKCIACGYANNADIVGAINILRAGHARLACGEKMLLGLSVKQEPAEVTQTQIV